MKEIQILDLPELPVQDQDYTLVVKPDGTHSKAKFGGLSDSIKESAQPVTVATYADAVPLFTGDTFKRVNVMTDNTEWGDGDKTFYTYDPEIGVAFMGWIFNYDE